MLDKLSDEKAYQISQLCENQARHLLFTYSNDELNGDDRFARFLSHICFPMIRRIFVGVELLDSEVKPAFTFETSVIPAFTVFCPDKYDGKEDYAVSATTYEFESFPGLEEVLKWAENSYTALDGEVEISIRLEELFINELNEKYNGKHIIFYAPITAIKSESGNDTLGYRCAILPGGSRLAAGGYE